LPLPLIAASIVLATTTEIKPEGIPVDPPSDQAQADIVVVGRGERRVGADRAASAGAISGDDIRTRPMLRTNELAEAVPGLLAVQHSGGGKAAQYFIRGYNLDHGTDFSIALDGVPMNLPSHAHGQGYLDLNGLIPETIDRVE
jgi:outer membrane cobalamin receptor